MNSAMTYTISTTSSAATIRLGQTIGARLKGGDVIELKGDVGSGKTTLTQGIVQGLGFSGEVPSPTFTLSRSYPLGSGLSLHHFDFYRLAGHDVVTEELSEALEDPQAIAVIEWPGHGQAELPARRLRVTIEATAEEHRRTITLQSLNGGCQKIMEEVGHDNRS